MKNFLFAIIVLVASTAVAQTIGPVNNECGKKCSGQFAVTNNGVTPVIVTVDPYLITVSKDHKPEFHPIEGKATVKLSTMSARLSPKQTYTFDYKVSCNELPCIVGFAAGMMTGQHTTEGLAVRVVMMSFVYECEKAKGCRASTLKTHGVEVAAK